jgi:hypothetical protein
MEKEKGLYLVPKQLCTLPEQGLFIVTLNTQTPDNYTSDKTPDLIEKISHLNKNLNTVFNDPTIARDIITHSALSKNGFNRDIAEQFNFPGANECLKLSEELYKDTLSQSEVTRLFNKGAIINYRSKQYNVSPLSYWTQNDSSNSLSITERLIVSGANPNCGFLLSNNSFYIAISKNDRPKLDALLRYYDNCGKSIISKEVWSKILILYYRDLMHFKKCPELIEHLIENVPQKSCTTGLIACLDIKEPGQEEQRAQLRQKFIDCNADTGAALAHCCQHIEMWGPNHGNSDFMQDCATLVSAGAYSKDAMITFLSLSSTFQLFALQANKNKQS